MSLLDAQTMMTCPYNKAHQVQKFRMQFHLEKCRKQHSKQPTVTCPFDATHIVNQAELDFHVLICREIRMLDRERYEIDDTAQFKPSVMYEPVPAPTTESWDDDDYPSYNPAASLATSNNIIRKIKGETPSVRRQFREEQRKKYNADTLSAPAASND